MLNCSKKKKNAFLKIRSLITGADDEARTRYLNLGKVALYQMSYIRIFLLFRFSLNDKIDYSVFFPKCQYFFKKFFKKFFINNADNTKNTILSAF